VATVTCQNSIAPVVQTPDRAKMAVVVAKKAIISSRFVSLQQKLQF
jgi:hypothetical protein